MCLAHVVLNSFNGNMIMAEVAKYRLLRLANMKLRIYSSFVSSSLSVEVSAHSHFIVPDKICQ